MRFKLLLSVLLVFLGLYLIINGSSALHQPHASAKTFWEKSGDFFTNNPTWNPLIEFFGGTPIPEQSIPRKAPAIVTLVTGILLFGGGVLYAVSVLRKRRH